MLRNVGIALVGAAIVFGLTLGTRQTRAGDDVIATRGPRAAARQAPSRAAAAAVAPQGELRLGWPNLSMMKGLGSAPVPQALFETLRGIDLSQPQNQNLNRLMWEMVGRSLSNLRKSASPAQQEQLTTELRAWREAIEALEQTLGEQPKRR
jgi:hypothetical protein